MTDIRLHQINLQGARIAVTGAAGQVGRLLSEEIGKSGGTAIRCGRVPSCGIDVAFDITDGGGVRRAMAQIAPDIVIHAAAMTDVDGCERNRDLAFAVNARGTGHVAAAARDAGAWLLAISTDYVFGGDQPGPNHEDDAARPLSSYGASKLAGEADLFRVSSDFAVARTAWLFGGPGRHFPRTILSLLRDRETIDVVEDERGNPTYARDLAIALLQLAVLRAAGTFHLTNDGSATRFTFARRVAAAAGLDPSRIRPTTQAAFLAQASLPARRPADSTLAHLRAQDLGITLRRWEEAVDEAIPPLAAELGLRGEQRVGASR